MRKLFFLFIAFHVTAICMAQVKVQYLLTENKVNPISIDALNPRFSWQMDAGDKRGVMQTAYELKVNSTKGKHEVWKTGKVSSDQSMYIIYKGEPLASGRKYVWQVRVWDNAGKASAWSQPATFSMGMLNATDWKAKWITPGFVEDSVNRPSPLFRKGFNLAKKVQSATAYITSHGLYEAQINGKRVGDAFLTPGWTTYNKRLQYQAYDVTNLLQPGANAVGATLGSGWYRGHIGFANKQNYYG
ncbi:MAG: alpha-L-rhamnosidase N-terminal domain-containing protein, partial [Mucilaginibacter sp.]